MTTTLKPLTPHETTPDRPEDFDALVGFTMRAVQLIHANIRVLAERQDVLLRAYSSGDDDWSGAA